MSDAYVKTIPGADGPKLNGDNYWVWIMFEDKDCTKPIMALFNKLEAGKTCEPSSCTVPANDNIYRYDCPQQDYREYSDQVFGSAPYVAYRSSYSDNKCDFENRGGAHVIRADGVCRRSFIADVLTDDLATVDSYHIPGEDMKCDDKNFRLRFTASDVKNQVCGVTSGNNSFMPIYYSGYDGEAALTLTPEPIAPKSIIPEQSPVPVTEVKSRSPSSTSATSETHEAANKDTNSATSSGAIAGIVVGGIALLLVVAVLVYVRKKRAEKTETIFADQDAFTQGEDKAPLAAQSYHSSTMGTGTTTNSSPGEANFLQVLQSFSSLRIDETELTDVRVLGRGAFAIVWLVTDRNNDPFASKRIIPGSSERFIDSFLDEIKLNASLQHPHIVTMRGVAWTSVHNLQVLFEFMEGGDLRSWLINEKAVQRTAWNDVKMVMAMDVLRALQFVHSLAHPIVHRDLKSGNVLLTKSHRAKIGDFGVARLQSMQSTMTTGVGTSLWLAPEVIMGKANYDQRADMYSFGVLLSELCSHELPFHGAENEDGHPLPISSIVYLVSQGALRPSIDTSTCPDVIHELALACLAQNPWVRPTAQSALLMLSEAFNYPDSQGHYV